MQAIGQLDQDNANVLCHRQHHLAKVFSLRLGLVLEIDLCQLGNTIDQFSNILAKGMLELFLCGWCIFNDIMQYGGHDSLVVHAHLSQDLGGCNGVGDIGFTSQAALPIMGFGAEQKGIINGADLLWIQVGIKDLAQVTYTKGLCAAFAGVIVNSDRVRRLACVRRGFCWYLTRGCQGRLHHSSRV